MILEHLIVKLSVDDAGYRKNLDQANKDLRQFKNFAKDAGRGIATFGAAIIGATAAITKMAQAGGKVVGVQQAFNNRLQEGAGAIAGLRTQTRGLLSNYELMQQANTALALGSADNAEQFGELANVSLRLSRAMGIDAAFALNSLNTGIARQSRLYLDNLGIIISVEEANEAYARSIGKTVSALSDAEKREAFRAAALSQANELVRSFGEQSDNAAVSADRFAASLKNLKDRTLQLVAVSPDVKTFLDLLTAGVTPGADGGTVLGSLLAGFKNVPGIGPTVKVLEKLLDRAKEAAEETEGLKTTIAELSGIDVSVSGTPRAPMAPLSAGGVFGAVGGVEDLLDAQEQLKKEAQTLQLGLAMEPGVKAAEELRDRLKDVQTQLRLVQGAINMFGGQAAAQMLATGELTGRGPLGDFRPGQMSGIGRATRTGRARNAQGAFFDVFETRGGTSPADVAESFGELIPQTELLTDNFGDTGGALDGFLGSLTSGLKDKFDPSKVLSNAAGNLLSSGISMITGAAFSAIGGLFGESPEEKERRRVVEANTKQLDRLNSGIARLGTAILGERGSDVQRIQAALAAPSVQVQAGMFPVELARLGLTLEDAERVAAGFGIELDGTQASLQAFREALKTDFLDQILNDFSTRFGIQQQMFGILGTSTEDQFKIMRESILRELIGGTSNPFDIATNPLIRGVMNLSAENFQAFAQDFFDRLLSGDETLFDQLGDLSIDEFISFLESAGQSLDVLGDAASEVAEAFRNVPSGYKVALRVFQAQDPELPPGMGRTDQNGRPRFPDTGMTGGGSPQFSITGPITVVSQDPDDMLRKIEARALRKAHRGGAVIATTNTRTGG